MNFRIHRGTSFSEAILLDSMIDPLLLAQGEIILQARRKPKSPETVLELSTNNGSILYEPSMGAMVISLVPEDTMAIKCDYASYDALALIPSSFGMDVRYLFGGYMEFLDINTRLPGVTVPNAQR